MAKWSVLVWLCACLGFAIAGFLGGGLIHQRPNAEMSRLNKDCYELQCRKRDLEGQVHQNITDILGLMGIARDDPDFPEYHYLWSAGIIHGHDDMGMVRLIKHPSHRRVGPEVSRVELALAFSQSFGYLAERKIIARPSKVPQVWKLADDEPAAGPAHPALVLLSRFPDFARAPERCSYLAPKKEPKVTVGAYASKWLLLILPNQFESSSPGDSRSRRLEVIALLRDKLRTRDQEPILEVDSVSGEDPVLTRQVFIRSLARAVAFRTGDSIKELEAAPQPDGREQLANRP